MSEQNDRCERFSYDEETVRRVSQSVQRENITEAANMFKALSDETRLKIAYALLLEDELCVCDVAHIIGASVATASHHLRLMKQLGLAKSRKEGKLVFYSLDDDHVKILVEIALLHSKEVMQRAR